MKTESYKLDPTFEETVVLALIRYPKFFGVVGHAIDPEALGKPLHALIVKTVRAVYKEIGHAPSEAIIVQRFRRNVDDGLVTFDELQEAIDFFLDAPESIPSYSEIVNELTPIIRRKLEGAVVRTAMEEFARKGDFEQTEKLITAAKAVGKVDRNAGLRLDGGAFARITRLAKMDRLPIGLDDLDYGLDGGMPRGCLGIYAAGTGCGKSMFLSSLAAHALASNRTVRVATLELNEETWTARVIANLTGEPVTKILAGDFKDARRKLEKRYASLGSLVVKDFPAKLTSMLDIVQWDREESETDGSEGDLLIVDYVDKCRSHKREDQNEYAGQNTVAETLRVHAHEMKIWAWSASQPQRKAGKDKNRRIESDDLADSQGKARVTDLLITGTKNADGDMLDYFVAKNRYGRGDFAVGPIPHDWAHGRMFV